MALRIKATRKNTRVVVTVDDVDAEEIADIANYNEGPALATSIHQPWTRENWHLLKELGDAAWKAYDEAVAEVGAQDNRADSLQRVDAFTVTYRARIDFARELAEMNLSEAIILIHKTADQHPNNSK